MILRRLKSVSEPGPREDEDGTKEQMEAYRRIMEKSGGS
jgi:hypothetical protein